MRIALLFACAATTVAGNVLCQAVADPTAKVRTAFVNVQVFEGSEFHRGSLVVENGLFVDAPPGSADTTIDLQGGFVLPAFGEAHNHNLHDQFDERVTEYLRAGVFYVKILSSVPSYTAKIRERINRWNSVDVSFTTLGFTSPGGHPAPLHESLLEQYGAYPGFTKETLRGGTYWAVETESDIERVWPAFLAGQPDFVKVYLAFSEDHPRRRMQAGSAGRFALDPLLLPAIVRRARAAGLMVTAHVESAQDFAVAVRSGVNEVAHLPGRREPQHLAEADIQEAARRGVTVVTTAGLARRIAGDTTLYASVRKAQADNLRRLLWAGVRLAVGSDDTQGSVVEEAEYLVGLGLSPAEVLRAWTEGSARSAFPNRQLGRLEPGYEASFIVLDGNPLTDFSAVRKIALRVKSGHVLAVP